MTVPQNATQHQISVVCGESSGTFDITVLPIGQSTYITPASGSAIDLSGTTRAVVLTAHLIGIKITPNSVASANYSAVVSSVEA